MEKTGRGFCRTSPDYRVAVRGLRFKPEVALAQNPLTALHSPDDWMPGAMQPFKRELAMSARASESQRYSMGLLSVLMLPNHTRHVLESTMMGLGNPVPCTNVGPIVERAQDSNKLAKVCSSRNRIRKTELLAYHRAFKHSQMGWWTRSRMYRVLVISSPINELQPEDGRRDTLRGRQGIDLAGNVHDIFPDLHRLRYQ